MRLDVDLAPPDRCTMRAPLVRAAVSDATRFLAEPRTLATLIVADSAPDPLRLTGAAAVSLDPAGPWRDPQQLPWFDLGAIPRMARAGSAWLGAFARPGRPGLERVGLWREGRAELVGEGDTFEALDLACTDRRCALLATRLAAVARPGAAVWLGAPGDPFAKWALAEIAPAGESDARPSAIAGIEGDEVTVALTEKADVVFWATSTGAGAGKAPREIARMPAPHGVIDVTAAPAPIAMTFATPVGDDGCAKEATPQGGAAVRFERPGQPAADVRSPAPPIGGFLRRLTRGALAAWIAPLGCNRPRRIVYAVVLDASGKPVGEPMAVGDGMSFAVAAQGDDVDLWVQHAGAVTWARMKCSAP